MLQSRSARRLPASTDNRANEKQIQRRRKAHPAQDWAKMKTVIYQYYVEEEKTQKEIVELLEKEHGFVIQLNMLKTRCKRWGFRKYFKSAEHEDVAKELTRCAEQGLSLPVDFKIDGRHPHLDRVLRRFRGKPQLASSCLQKNSEWQAQISRVCLKASSTDHCTEVTLIQTKLYWTAALAKPLATNLTEASAQNDRSSTYDSYTLIIGFLGGLTLINEGEKRQGWQEIHSTCEKVKTVLKKQQPDLFTSLLSLFSSRLWYRHPEILSLVIQYLLSFSRDHLGTGHPLSKMLDAFAMLVAAKTSVALEVCEVIPELALKVIVDFAEAKQSQVAIDSSYFHAVEADLIAKVRARLGPVAARKMIQKKYSHWRSTLGDRNRHALALRFDLASTFLAEARSIDKREKPHEKLIAEQKGESLLLKIVVQGEKFPADRYRMGSYCLAAQSLARFYFAKQDFTSAHTYFLRAVLWATEKFGSHRSCTSRMLKEFQALRKLVKLGLVDVAAEEEHSWQVHTGKEGSVEAVEEGDFEPHHDEIDLEDNLELVEHKIMPQPAVAALLGSMDDNHVHDSNGALPPTELGAQSEATDDLANQGFEHRHVQEAEPSHASDLDTSIPNTYQDAQFATEMTFEGLLTASAQDVLDLFPEDHTRHEAQLDDLNEPLGYYR